MTRPPDQLAREVRNVLEREYGHAHSVGARAAATQANRALAALAELQAQAEANVLPDDTVCACLSETGSRTVRLYERCQRCGAFMEADYLAAAAPSPADQKPAIAFERSLLRADIRAGNTEAAALQRDRVIKQEKEEE